MQETRRSERSFAAVVDESLGPVQQPEVDKAGPPGCLGKLVESPSIGELENAPQTALLAVLEHALTVAAVSLAYRSRATDGSHRPGNAGISPASSITAGCSLPTAEPMLCGGMRLLGRANGKELAPPANHI